MKSNYISEYSDEIKIYNRMDGSKEWTYKNRLHRVDGPAVVAFGYNYWYINGIRFHSKDEWFAALTPEQKENYIWK